MLPRAIPPCIPQSPEYSPRCAGGREPGPSSQDRHLVPFDVRAQSRVDGRKSKDVDGATETCLEPKLEGCQVQKTRPLRQFHEEVEVTLFVGLPACRGAKEGSACDSRFFQDGQDLFRDGFQVRVHDTSSIPDSPALTARCPRSERALGLPPEGWRAPPRIAPPEDAGAHRGSAVLDGQSHTGGRARRRGPPDPTAPGPTVTAGS